MARTPLYCYNRFNVIIDRQGDPSITDKEFSEQYNMAALSILKDRFGNEHLQDQSGNVPYAWEMTDTDTVKWQPQIEGKEFTSDANGKVLNTAIESGINGKIFKIRFDRLMIDGKTYRYCRFVRQNDAGIQAQNIFKKPRELFPIWRGFNGYFLIEPAAARTIRTTVVKYPSELVLDFTNRANNRDTDLTDSAIEDVLWRMAAQYGVQIREQQLVDNATMQEKEQ